MWLSTSTVHPDSLHAWTGLTGPQFRELVTRLRRRRPDRARGRPWRLPFDDRVLLVAVAYRTNLTERQLAALFGVSRGTAHRILADLAPHFAALLEPPPTDRRELWIVDGTLIPVHDQERTAKSKNYRRSVNTQVVVRRRDRRVVAVSDTCWPGNRNDPVVYRATIGDRLARHPRLVGDGGYRGVAGVTSPTRDSAGRIVRDDTWKRFTRRRATVEHVIARLKDWQILRQCRRRGRGIDYAVAGVAALYNLRLDTA